MSSYARLRFGAAVEDLLITDGETRGQIALAPIGVAEADLTLDRKGFHHLTFESGVEAPVLLTSDPPEPRVRFMNELAYELIVLAVNDQPITVRATVAGREG